MYFMLSLLVDSFTNLTTNVKIKQCGLTQDVTVGGGKALGIWKLCASRSILM